MLTVISGGQTGVDRAALDAAIAAGVPYGGWCPKGGWAEDMSDSPGLLAHYPLLRETPDAAPEQRTDWNVRDCDALMVLTGAQGIGVSKGTERVVEHAAALGKPLIVIDIDKPDALRLARNFSRMRPGDAICIAGPREGEIPGLYAKARTFLETLLKHVSSAG